MTDSPAPLRPSEADAVLAEAAASGRLSRAGAERLGASLQDAAVRERLLEVAYDWKRRGKGDVVTFSRNIFIPLTNLCRNRCAYCTFAKAPDSAEAKTYTLDEVAEAVRGGVLTGCIEALLCLGDKPELAYRSYRDLLASAGYRSTTDLIALSCKVAFEGGMLPHTNAGILSPDEMEALRPWNASMGLMLETTSQRLRGKGGPHYYAPDKEPAVRLRMHAQAGELKIPFTTGLLLGIGETVPERVDTLFAIQEIAERYGHIQETIVQPFHPKPGTRMRAVAALPDAEVAGWVAIARLVLGPEMNLQAPPNLAPEVLELLVRSGLNDWGGVSPVTVDFINPEAPWPTLSQLRTRTEASGQQLLERGPVYPDWIRERPDFFDPQVRAVLPRYANDEGYARRKPHQSGEEAA